MSIETYHMTQTVQTLLKEKALMEGKGEKEDMVSQGAETAKMVVKDARKTQEQAAEMEKEKAKDKCFGVKYMGVQWIMTQRGE